MDCSDEIKLLQKEQLWIHRFITLIHNGLNKRQEMPPPIPFVFLYNDIVSDIANLVKEVDGKSRKEEEILPPNTISNSVQKECQPQGSNSKI